ncbi:MAG: hypothetical protein HZB59_04410 [Ignavibacteriales bacterium]|nr:hypothetical protein [Ignavibacteriales bacterium]
MKFRVNILILPIYILFSIGVPVILHTCGDRTNAFVSAKTPDDPCGDACGADCCELSVKVFHLEDSQIQIIQGQNLVTSIPFLHIGGVLDLNPIQNIFTYLSVSDKSPPGKISKYKIDCVFLI